MTVALRHTEGSFAMKKIVAINCSPRTGWNTATLVREAAQRGEIRSLADASSSQQRRLRAKPPAVRKACSDRVVQVITFIGIPSSRRRSRNSSPAISGSYRSSSRCSWQCRSWRGCGIRRQSRCPGRFQRYHIGVRHGGRWRAWDAPRFLFRSA